MCKWGTDVVVRLSRPLAISGRTEVAVDACLAPLVQMLNDYGVETVGCCCGHERGVGSILYRQDGHVRSMTLAPLAPCLTPNSQFRGVALMSNDSTAGTMERQEHFNQLTPAEHERLSLLLEEAGEIVQACGKILRHGYESHDPTSASVSPSNREALETELGDIEHAVDRMIKAGDVSVLSINDARVSKSGRIERWLHHD